MRPYLLALLFAFAALAAACGGGGGSGAIVPGTTSHPSAPQSGGAALTLKIPAQSRSGSIKRPAYVSPNTQSVQVYAISVGASPAPMTSPSVAPQTFPVTTPSPCSQAADGSKTCTFEVQAPFGNDQFIIATYDVPSPGPSNVPLAVFETGVISVQLGSTPAPVALTLTGVVSSVDLAMQSPDPGISTSTQLQPVGTALTGQRLSITPKDASGSPIVTDTFQSPITISLAPINSGVTLSLSASQCSPASAVNGGIATITCAKDLGSLLYTYDGSIARDGLNHVVDRFTFSAQPQPQQTPAPATLALTGTMIPVALPSPGAFNPFPFQFIRQSNGTFYYLAGSGTSEFGSFDPSGSAPSQAASLPFFASGIAIDTFGGIWIGVNNSGTGNSLQCFASVSPTLANAISLPNAIAPIALTTDTTGNIWYYGLDANRTSWAGYFAPSSICQTSGPMPNPLQFSTIADYPQTMVADPNGNVWLLSNSNGSIYSLNTSSPSIITKPFTSPTASYSGESLAIDGAGNLYGSFPPYAALAPILGEVPAGSSTFNSASLEPGASVGGLDVFPLTGAATQLTYADGLGLATMNLSPNFGTSNLQVVPITASSRNASAFFDKNGDAWMAYVDANLNPALVHLIRTSVWTIANPSLTVFATGGTVNIAISETGDSGPFTVSNISNAAAAAIAPPYPGIDHLIPLQISPGVVGTVPLTLTVTDANHRSETVTFSVTYRALTARRRNSATLPSHVGQPH